MNLSEVAAEIAARLDTIEGLSSFPYQPQSLTPPAAWVANPAQDGIVYDETYRRGTDRMTLPVFVAVGRGENRSAQDAARAYLDGSGPRSFKEVLESGTYTSFDIVRVMRAGVIGVSIAGVDYLAALFDLDIIGQGS